MHTLPRFIAAAAMAAALVAPTAAAASDQLNLTDSTERIGPGVTLRHLVSLSEIGWTDAQVMTVDLQAQGVKADLLTAGAVARGSALSAQVRQAGAVAGVNADFFDINNSNAAIGPEIQNGVVRKSGFGSTQVAGVTNGRLGRLAKLTLDATASCRAARASSRASTTRPTRARTRSSPTRRCGARTRAPAASAARPTSPR